MKILTIRTDKPEAEIGLFKDHEQVDYEVWAAHRELSLTILPKIEELLKRNRLAFQDIQGVVAFRGPGSFTGLRIGLSVANAFAYGLNVPLAGSDREDWIADGIKRLRKGENERIALPKYERAPNITKQKK
jgi:tRNA threonylcarbamoyladenosine biosynthesis protein TsaB